MRLCILTQYYPPEIGAPQARLSELAAHFVQRGHTVTVLTAMPNYPRGRVYDGYGGLYRREEIRGVQVRRSFIYPTQRTDFVHRLTNYFSFVASSALFGTFGLGRCDFLMVESPPLFLGGAGCWLSRCHRARLIFNVSDLWPESAVRLGLVRAGSRVHRLSAWLEAFCYRHAWLVTGQSKTILNDIQRRFPECPTFHLSNGVDTTRFGRHRSSAATRAALGGPDELVCLYAGLHGVAQGLDQVLQAAARLQGWDHLKFVLVGDGPEKAQLEQAAARGGLRNVRFLPPRPAQDIPELLAAADILLVPLKTYIPGAVPSKLYEAMASERPVILVAQGEAADIVNQSHAGLVVEPGNVDGLVEALEQLCQQPATRERLGAQGRLAAQQSFDRQLIVGRFLDFLESRCAAPPCG
jgi:glycosyltransferase involved in cell wall biosynthesis